MPTELREPDKPWAMPPEEVARRLGVDPERGLDEAEARERLRRFGPNRLREVRRKSAWRILADQFESLIVLLLVAAAVLSLAFGKYPEAVAIAAVIALNTAIGFFTELRAVRSMEALRRLGSLTARVRRGGQVRELPAPELVPGDIVLVEGGDLVSADLRLVEASKLQADESALTGESLPVGKEVGPVPEGAALGERKGMLFKGTAVTRGSGEGVVVATGMRTELGQISELVAEAEPQQTPLEARLEQLGHYLIWLTLGIVVLAVLAGVSSGKPLLLMIETAIALAVAAIPEGLPIVATVALARGMWRMARRNALINQLAAVEALGATGVIFTDKTGTLTENRMTVTLLVTAAGEVEVRGEGEPFPPDGNPLNPGGQEVLREALEVGVLCNNASLRPAGAGDAEAQGVGDPLEVALLAAGERAGLRREELTRKWEEVREEPFDPDVRMMATFHRDGGRVRVAVKGAPEAVVPVCTRVREAGGGRELTEEERQEWLRRSQGLAARGLRMLALATKDVDDPGAPPYEGLTLLALVGLLDPPRGDVRDAIRQCREAGIRVVMVTGDHAATAATIADAVGLAERGEAVVVEGKDLKDPREMSEAELRRAREAVVFARVSPRQKLDLISLYQERGAVVAMTGDGVNDAPALKKADIGVAMGRRGTQVAREAADMVLKDDAFSTIVAAIEQGRVIFNNIRKFVVYLLSCNISEILIVALAAAADAPLPVLPLQILFLNLVTDVFPALALGAGEGEPGAMKRPPRPPGEAILTRRHWLAVGGYGLLITVAVLGAFALALSWLGMGTQQAVTVSFLTLGFAQVWHVFNMRQSGSGLWGNEVTRNPFVWGAVALCAALLLAAVYLPGLRTVLGVADPGAAGWGLVLGMSLIPLAAGQFLKEMAKRAGPAR
ncbi:MAG TPA: cation-transporting P-type ATPase [Gemmataceae bacterium]